MEFRKCGKCLICGKALPGWPPHRKTCSNKCRQKLFREVAKIKVQLEIAAEVEARERKARQQRGERP